MIKTFILPLINKPNWNILARKVENYYPNLKNRLLTSLELWKIEQNNREGYSNLLMDSVIKDTAEKAKGYNFRKVLSPYFLWYWGRLVLLGIVIYIAYFTLFSNTFIPALERLLHPSFIPSLPQYEFTITPGDIEILKGDSLKVIAQINGLSSEGNKVFPQNVILYSKNYGTRWKQNEMERINSNTYKYLLPAIDRLTEYYIKVDYGQSEIYTITVRTLPIITQIKLTYVYPAYTRLPSKEVAENNGDIIALRGTRVYIEITSNNPVKSGALIFPTYEIPLDIDIDKNNPRFLKGLITVRRNESYYIRLTDTEGHNNDSALEYTISVLKDESPSIRLTRPGRDCDLPESMKLLLSSEASDDYGLTKMYLVYKKQDEFRNIPIKVELSDAAGNTTEHSTYIKQFESENEEIKVLINEYPARNKQIKQDYTWDLSKLNLLPEESISYYIEVYDNDTITGPKVARTATYIVRFPSLYEIFEEVDMEQSFTISELEKMVPDAEELYNQMEEIRLEMLKDPNLDWEQRQAIEEAIQKQEEMIQNIEELSEQVGETLEKMEENLPLNLEMMSKMQELQELMNEMASEELQKALDEMKEAMQELNPEELQKAMEQMTFSQEDYISKLERTIDLLKQIQREQQMEAVVQKMEELIRRQEALEEQTKQAKSQEELHKVSEEQEELGEDLEQLQEEIDELAENLKEDNPDVSEELEQISEAMEDEQLSEKMQEVSNELQKGQQEQAGMKQKQISESMKSLSNSLQMAQSNMQQELKQEVLDAMRKSIKDLLYLSKEEEKLMEEMAKLNTKNDDAYRETAENQNNLLQALSRVADSLGVTAQKSFYITPEIMKELGQSMKSMQKSLQALEQRQGNNASAQGKSALFSMNSTIKALMQSSNSCSSGQSGTGEQMLLQRLQQMTGQQEGMNSETQKLMEQMMQQQMGLSMEARAQMARMAAEQMALQKSLEQLLQEMGEQGDILGRLDDVSKDMEEVAKQMQNGNIDRDLIDRQDKILSRMLNAQRSMHEREYSKRREANTGEDIAREGPSTLPSGLGENEDYREDLLRALQEGYPAEYEELIKAYFKA